MATNWFSGFTKLAFVRNNMNSCRISKNSTFSAELSAHPTPCTMDHQVNVSETPACHKDKHAFEQELQEWRTH
jgi:hypothetical protein